jgi:fumarate reductase subunit D
MARSNEPLWWGPFSAGMMVGALCDPALIVLTVLVPIVRPDKAEAFRLLIDHPLSRLFLLVVISLSLFHWAHRFRYILFDLGVHGGKDVIAYLCYGSAIVGTLVTAALALHLF